jgi:putative ABC transport system permease protein
MAERKRRCSTHRGFETLPWSRAWSSVIPDRHSAAVVTCASRSRVTQRTRELGIRLALGARASSVQALVLRQGLGLTLTGLGLGILGALALSRLLTTLLYGVSPTDPQVLGLSVLVLALVSMVACLIPAIRATKVDPIEALRSE